MIELLPAALLLVDLSIIDDRRSIPDQYEKYYDRGFERGVFKTYQLEYLSTSQLDSLKISLKILLTIIKVN